MRHAPMKSASKNSFAPRGKVGTVGKQVRRAHLAAGESDPQVGGLASMERGSAPHDNEPWRARGSQSFPKGADSAAKRTALKGAMRRLS